MVRRCWKAPPDPDGVDGSVAALWKASTGTWQSLGYLPNAPNCPSKSDGYELSADGSVAVGLSWDGCSGRGFRWTEATGMVELESLANGKNRASVISADGSVIGGFAQGSFSRTPSVWDGTTATGQLLDPPNGDALGEVHGIRDDGSILLGNWIAQDDPLGAPRAMTWTDNNGTWDRQMIASGSFRPGWQGIPLDIADNDTIVGFDILPGSGIRRGWIYPEGSGALQELNSWVPANGGTIPLMNGSPIVLEVPQAISANGRVIVGHGGGNAWRIQILSDCDFDGDTRCDIDDVDALIAAIAGVDQRIPLFDLNANGNVDLADRDEWLAQAGAENLTSGGADLVGDANLDGVVDVSDFNLWNGSKFTTTAAWSLADFNADGSDGTCRISICGIAISSPAATSLAVVPEPAAHVMSLGVASMYWFARRRLNP